MKAVEPRYHALRLSFRPLAIATVVCLVAAAMAFGVGKVADAAKLNQSNAAADLVAAELALQNTQADRARLEANLQLFVRLRKDRFVEPPDRLRILETLENASKEMRRSEIAWDMGPEEKKKTLNDDKSGAAVAQLLRVPLKISSKGVHEEEWLTLLARLQNAGAGYFATESCTYVKDVFAKSQISLPAVNATCNLSWLYVVPEIPAVKTP